MAYEAYLLDKLDQEHNSKGFHEKVHEKFHKVAHHVKHHIEKAKASSVFMNYAIIAALGALITLAVCLAYQPFAYVPFPSETTMSNQHCVSDFLMFDFPGKK